MVVIGDEEIHLVAMPSKLKKFPCFWCCLVPAQLYNACLGMLNMRCLAIVFDLDETLIVANTMKSFEDRIEVLTGWIGQESDSIRVSGMTSELKRFVEDRALLKQYIENNSVTDNGQTYNVKLEEVHMNAAGNERVVRPVIRLPEKNIVLTRINPEVRRLIASIYSPSYFLFRRLNFISATCKLEKLERMIQLIHMNDLFACLFLWTYIISNVIISSFTSGLIYC